MRAARTKFVFPLILAFAVIATSARAQVPFAFWKPLASNSALNSGQMEFRTVGNNSWVVPAGVTSISAVAIGAGGNGGSVANASQDFAHGGGGGALSYKNNIAVTPGETLTIKVPAGGSGAVASIERGGTQLLYANSGGYMTGGSNSGVAGSTTYAGGRGGYGQFTPDGMGDGWNVSGGGGGAAGYAGNGGAGADRDMMNGDTFSSVPAGGSGAAYGGGNKGNNGGGGGGVGIYGIGETAAAVHEGGSLGASTTYVTGSSGAPTGGGSGGGDGAKTPGQGAVRIVWGAGRSYPSAAPDIYPNQVTVYLATLGAGTWTVPADWNSANNRIEVLGAGGNGHAYIAGQNGFGGGGGGYATKANMTFTPGASISYFVSSPTDGSSWFQSNTTVKAGSGSTYGSIGRFEYGDFGFVGGSAGYNGGGAAGPKGDGVAGNANANFASAGKAGVMNVSNATKGSEFGALYGTGGGGAGHCGTPSGGFTRDAANYGGGGGGGCNGGGVVGAGGQGLIVIKYSPIVAGANGEPTALALTHSPRNKAFTVSWTAGSGNGGASGCKLQYQANGTTWTDLSGTYNCDANASSVSASLPSTSYWTNNFNSTGVSIRLVRVSDSALMGSFSSKATCTTTAASAIPTTNIDENCNSQWDDTYQSSYTDSSSSTSFGASYSVPATVMYYDGTLQTMVTASFSEIVWYMQTSPTKIYWSDLSCQNYQFVGSGYGSNQSSSTSGSVPSTDGTGLSLTTTACQPEGGQSVNFTSSYSSWWGVNANYYQSTPYYF